MKKRIATILTAGLLYVVFLTAFSFIDSKVNAAENTNIQNVHEPVSGDPYPPPPPPDKKPGGLTGDPYPPPPPPNK